MQWRTGMAFVLGVVALAFAACSGGTAELFAEPTAADGAPEVAATTEITGRNDDEPTGSTPPPIAPTPNNARPVEEDEGDRRPVVVLDPGHGGDEIGAAAHGISEKVSNLDMAFRIEAILLDAGVEVVLTRRDDERVAGTEATGFARSRIDRQARVDIANDAGADVFVSVHSNGIGDSSVRGLETYYNSQRSFADENVALARAVQDSVLREVARAGYPLVDRGIRDDSCLFVHRDICRPIFVLGPARERGASPSASISPATRATEMPGALVELLFITNAADAALLDNEVVRDAMALGVAEGILAFLADSGLWPEEPH